MLICCMALVRLICAFSAVVCAGKSTQTPQFLLDLMLESGQGSATNILVTQPRRISAIGLAERVADERAERCGQSVGYRIRGENKVSQHTRLTFVTTGVLLRQLTSPSALAKISHIVIDEVHERSTEIDFLLLILKQLLPSYPWLKLVLMSATVRRTPARVQRHVAAHAQRSAHVHVHSHRSLACDGICCCVLLPLFSWTLQCSAATSAVRRCVRFCPWRGAPSPCRTTT